MHAVKRICVYCGSNKGVSPTYGAAAVELARALVDNDLQLVFGGSCKGIMGVIADQVIALGGSAVGVLPRSLLMKEVAHEGLTEMHIVDTMHERKSLMSELSDGFIALPGGSGTLEEIVESFTWAQLQFHAKPCGLLNVDGYYDYLIAFLDNASTQGFIRPAHREMLQVEANAKTLLEKFADYRAPVLDKWIDAPPKPALK